MKTLSILMMFLFGTLTWFLEVIIKHLIVMPLAIVVGIIMILAAEKEAAKSDWWNTIWKYGFTWVDTFYLTRAVVDWLDINE
jgi:hypothetical protein